MEGTEFSRKNKETDLTSVAVTKRRIAEDICRVDTRFGNWISRYDLEADPYERRLRLADQGEAGYCGVECKTIAEACHRVMRPEKERFAAGLFENTHWHKMVQV